MSDKSCKVTEELPETIEDFLFLIEYYGDSCVYIQNRNAPDLDYYDKDNQETWEEIKAVAKDYFRMKNEKNTL